MSVIPEYDSYSSDYEELLEEKQKIIADLLEACKAIVREYDAETASYDFPTPDDFADFCFEQAQEAIAKAEST